MWIFHLNLPCNAVWKKQLSVDKVTEKTNKAMITNIKVVSDQRQLEWGDCV